MKQIKKILLLFLVLCLCFVQVVFANDALIAPNPNSGEPVEIGENDGQIIFEDIDSSHFAYESTVYLVKSGYISGDGSGKIRPEDNITREETAKIALNINKVTIETGIETDIKDFDAVSEWAKDYVATAYKYGVMRGDEDGNYRPADSVTRAEAVAIAMRAINITVPGATCSFADVGEDDWYYEYVGAAQNLGFIKGDGDNTFRPDDKITRAESFVLFERISSFRTILEETPAE